ncbi:MAG TPA: acyl-CoA dehydrogenase family protein [Acidimicrobiales bacterium]|nr:acyl-CoA dehydrogenase family protein [Acidimicrobiales bacterium]
MAPTHLDELQRFLDEHPYGGDNPGFVRALGEAGWVAPHWAPEHGGRGLTEQQAIEVYAHLDERELPRQPRGSGFVLAAPTILQHSEEATKRRFLPPIASGEERWCQLFSEPGAGSDLASLACTAVRDGDEWIVSGQKVWTTYGHESEMAMLLARTDPTAAKHAGITYFGMDMRAPGVEIRPLVQMTGETEFNEVFLTDVRVPDLFRISPVHDGWAATQTTLGAERFALSGVRKKKKASDEILGGKTIADVMAMPGDRTDERARAYVESRVLELVTARRLHGSMTKIGKARTNQDLQLLAVEQLGAHATAWETGDDVPPGFVRELLRTRANSIEGGTSEIQRNIVGERVLGLPREPDPFKGQPWREVPRS